MASLYESLTRTLVRLLPSSYFLALRGLYLKVRRKGTRILQLVHGSFDTDELIRHLHERIGDDWKIIMIHSSMNKLHPMYKGNALDLLNGLKTMCGDSKTLVMPTFYFGADPDVGVAREFSENPEINMQRTPSQMGMLTELFRRSRGVAHSLNPIYRISALGPLAGDLVSGHERATTLCGQGTPFDFMDRNNTVIVGIGKTHDVLTHVHHIEDMMGEDYPVPRTRRDPIPMQLVSGKSRVDYALPRKGFEWRRDMGLLDAVVGPGVIRSWTFHGVPMFAVKADELTSALRAAAEKGRTIYVPVNKS